MGYTFIVNPKSRSGKGAEIWKQVRSRLAQKGIEAEVFLTKYRSHAMKLASQISMRGIPTTLVVIGGDGTVNEVVGGIQDFSRITLGYIPAGSGNDFARGLGLSIDPMVALEAILNPQEIKQIDLGTVTRAGKTRRFMVSCGMGFDAAVCHQAVVSKWKTRLNKVGLGKLTYVGIALQRLFNDAPVGLTMTVDEAPPVTFNKTFFVAFMNTPFEGGGFKFCPEAQPDDGLLDIILVADIPKLAMLRVLPGAFSGKHVKHKGVHIYRGKRISVVADRPMMIHSDGEALFLRKELYAEILPSQLRMIVA